ncbi:MAG TPA: aminotransferase class I/II-fold pyridoxal phosphate-dependent enzyme [Thermoanaerobaculia bacterium]|nr:aminotransferase class I/II-fold pyridoxal phosphate-dependent enzyme [Thermoanaerobaculia bacterium]
MADRDRPHPRELDTAAVRAGEDDATGALVDPIWQTAPFWFKDVAELERTALGERPDLFYSRYGNPTITGAERKMAALEGTEDAVLFSSGLSAIGVSLRALLSPGDHIVATEDLYGGTLLLFRDVFSAAGIAVSLVPTAPEPDFASAIRPETRLLYVETPTNPLVKIVDLAFVARTAKERGLLCAVDSTFGSPVLQRPAAAGFDLVLHSATKYLNGHADVTAGFACASFAAAARLRGARKMSGTVLDPHAAWLLTRGMKTVALRVRAQSANAMEIARRLASHPAVERVHYPGLPDHPGHAAAARQMSGAFGAMLAFDVRGGAPAARRPVEALRLIRRATSLGSVESTADLPAITSHSRAMIAPERREALGIRESTIRLSVGAEDVRDIVADLEAALAAARDATPDVARHAAPGAGRE